ncbi:type ISP restriction/modification enzyme [Streptomyces sp. NRRL WC-3549]|uniref:type ISP restriction/modification enzyme n=1 Tax=Streptomyces sp. NRRL WC-3549 TaxID=1463925 RepID=UPI0009EA7115|nr:type ISP restriction/modification enzyme [Streptomyces sp. NRRL WC-3549]
MNFAEVVAAYGQDAKQRLSGPGQREALLITPVSNLVEQAGALLGLSVVAHNEVAELDGSVRPDFGVRVNGVITGHVELKAPGVSLDPSSYGISTHNYKQWQRLRELPNLLHTNGTEFRLWRYGELVDTPVHIHRVDLVSESGRLTAPGRLELVFNSFLQWSPTPIVSVPKLVSVLAPLARLLREEVHEALRAERRAIRAGADATRMPFTGISKDWRRLLFPQATDSEFSDGFAQTVVFALLLALSEGIDLDNEPIREIAHQLEGHHSLMGRALNLLTEHVEKTPTWSAIEIILHVLAAADWGRLGRNGDELYLHLYEDFLASYDPEKRRSSGSYYTPVPVVDAMVRLTDLALKHYMGKPDGFRNPHVNIVDPAMGTGTYPLSILRHVAGEAAAQYGPGAAPEAVSNAVSRTYGIELQSGPFSVAELRISSTISDLGADLPSDGLNLFVADTLEDPYSASDSQLSFTAQLIARQRQRANQMKRERNVQVCIGNPPYKDHAGGVGGWVENGADPATGKPPLEAFKLPGNGKHERHLSNLYAYFWRWATWKVFESTNQPDERDGGNGVICFITATGYLAGPGFKGMREYLRRMCSHGWIINVTPEGKQPPAANAVFNIETPVAIALFLRKQGVDDTKPAEIKYIDLNGTKKQKFEQLSALTFDHQHWRSVRPEWTAPFTPSAATGWDDYPAVDDLLPWRANGIMAGRSWVYAPTPGVLDFRLRSVINEDDPAVKSQKFKEKRDASLVKTKKPLPGADTEQETNIPFGRITMLTEAHAVRCGFRMLDRQWLIADSRLLSQPSPTLWEGRVDGQVFAIELHSEYPKAGPGIVYTNLIPDVHHFRGSGGGRALPKLHPDGTPNVAPGLVDALSRLMGVPISHGDIFSYIAGITGHSDFVAQFDDELRTPGVRVPVTKDPHLWARACQLGAHVQWLHTYGEAGNHPQGLTEIRDPAISVDHPSYAVAVGSNMPTDWRYDASSRSLHVGAGRWDGLTKQAAEYTVGGRKVLDSWLDYRMAEPKGRITSPLDEMNAPQWDSQWSTELTNLLSILTQLVNLEDQMSDLLTDVIASEIFTRQELAAAGTQWPTTDADRRPRLTVTGGLFGELPPA